MGLNGFANNNTAMGNGALFFNTNGNSNTCLGFNALNNTTGDSNIALGDSAGPISPPAVTTSILATKVKLASLITSALAQKELTRIRLSPVLVEQPLLEV